MIISVPYHMYLCVASYCSEFVMTPKIGRQSVSFPNCIWLPEKSPIPDARFGLVGPHQWYVGTEGRHSSIHIVPADTDTQQQQWVGRAGDDCALGTVSVCVRVRVRNRSELTHLDSLLRHVVISWISWKVIVTGAGNKLETAKMTSHQ